MKIQTLGARLRHVRTKRRLTQIQLAAMAGIKQSALSSLETNRTRQARASTLLHLAAALDVDPAWLQSGSGSETPPTWNPPDDQFIAVLGALSPDNRRRLHFIARAMLADQSEQADVPIPGESAPKRGRTKPGRSPG